MATPNWGLLAKSNVDDETIEEAIARLITAHNDDEEAHLGTGQALQSHKASEVIDHLAASIIDDKLALRSAKYDKLAFDRSALFFNWSSIDGWGTSEVGSGVVTYGIARLLLATGKTANSKAEIYADESVNAINPDCDATPRSVHSLRVSRVGDGDVFAGFGNQEENGFGFKFEPSVVAEVRPEGDVNKNWSCSATMHTGQYVLAGVDSGRLWLSTDYGATWDEVRPAGDFDKSWIKVAMDRTGQHMVACVYNGRVYRSVDYGATWAETQPVGNADAGWYNMVMDQYAGDVLICPTSGRLWLSTDYGATWAETRPLGDTSQNWRGICIGNSGAFMIASVYNGRVYRSANSGSTWAETQPNGATNYEWRSCACSDSMDRILIGQTSGRLYYSSNFGVGWSEVQPAGAVNKDWYALAVTTGTLGLFAVANNGRLYYNLSGTTGWVEATWGGASNKDWWALCVSDDRMSFYGGYKSGRLWRRDMAASKLSAYVRNPDYDFSTVIDADFYSEVYFRCEIILTPATKIEYYIDDVLVATIYDADITDGIPVGGIPELWDFMAENLATGEVNMYSRDLTILPNSS